MTAVASADDQLAWEADKRTPAAVAGIVGGVLSLVWIILSVRLSSGVPASSALSSLDRLDGDPYRPIGATPSNQLDGLRYFSDRTVLQVITALVLVVSIVAAAGLLLYLMRATRARAERYPRPTRFVIVIGSALLAVGALVIAISGASFYSRAAGSSGTVDAVRALTPKEAYSAGLGFRYVGGFAVGLAYIIVSLQAMRVGLLGRFLGIVGVGAGGLVVLSPAYSIVIQGFWLLSIGVLLLERFPNVVLPPAWSTGRAEPWAPSVRRQSEDKPRKPARGRPTAPPEPEAVEARAAAKPHPSSKKKRKRRQ